MASGAPVEGPAAVVDMKLQPSGASYIQHHLRSLAAYQHVLPFQGVICSAWRKAEDIIKLEANENPYGPPPEVATALENLKFPYVHPDSEGRHLCAPLAEDSGLETEHILVGCGANKLIDLIMRYFFNQVTKL